MSRLGLASLWVVIFSAFLGGSVGEAKAQTLSSARVEALVQRVEGDPHLVLAALDLLQRPSDRVLGLRLAEAVILEERGARVVAAALVQSAVAAGQLELHRVRLRLGPEVSDLLGELSCTSVLCVSPQESARLKAHYTRFRAASRGAHVLEFHVRLDAVRNLDGLELPLQLGVLRATRQRVVPALRQGSPDLARRLDDELEKLVARATARLEEEVASRLAPCRRADGTLRWDAVLEGKLLQRAGEQPHFTLGLFLRELAVVVQSGAEERIEELFDGLARTDFFLQYGLFSLGSHEVPYHRYLERFVKPRFVHELLRTNVVVASGVALPSIAAGTFRGDAFGINLSTLGLSTPATSKGLAALRWVQRVGSMRSTQLLRHMSRLSALQTVGGWVYTTVEILVVLYVSEELKPWIRARIERQAAEEELREAEQAFFEGLGRAPNAAQARELGASFHAAWIRYRDFLYAPVLTEEQKLTVRLEKLARRLKLISDQRDAVLDNLPAYPALVGYAASRRGSLRDYVDGWLLRVSTDTAQEQVDAAIGDYVDARRRHLVAVYAENRRPHDYLAKVGHPHWHVLGGVTGAPEDPFQSTFQSFADRGRVKSRSEFAKGLCDPSRNRLQAYEDERRVLNLAIEALAGRNGDLAAIEALVELRDLVARTEDLDHELGRVVTRGFVRALDAGR